MFADVSNNFESRSWQFQSGVDVQVLKTELDAQPKVLRAKGRVRDEAGALWVLQKVGSVCSVTPAQAADDDHAAGLLVLITLRGDMPDALAWAIYR